MTRVRSFGPITQGPAISARGRPRPTRTGAILNRVRHLGLRITSAPRLALSVSRSPRAILFPEGPGREEGRTGRGVGRGPRGPRQLIVSVLPELTASVFVAHVAVAVL
jgi:hypothetical protein